MELSAANLNLHNQQRLPATTIPLSQMLRPRTVGGKVAVNVRDFSVYAQFKHITVSPSPDNASGYSSSRLRVLDTLIDRLVQMKERSMERDSEKDVSGLSTEAIDAMIQEYAQKYRNLQSQGIQGISRDLGANFGVHDSENALLLNMTA
ncbi:hypothetical protein [Salinispira pacifica]|uniref:Uncharacterized protein n=1 Tax=Salinispira pacifica TaxID=1307761 RepID=V5WM48_9SPIO|nr:hypothetical protein [Salinispira pacifica]AHC16176.1 hypothetical protein L21SP2_2826 [Salinispira pacifica]